MEFEDVVENQTGGAASAKWLRGRNFAGPELSVTATTSASPSSQLKEPL